MEQKRKDDLYIVAWVILVLFGAGLRLYRIADLPAGMHVDEAGMAYDAFCLANYHTDRFLNHLPVYLINFGSGQSSLYAYLCAFWIKLFGVNIYTIRIPAFISGMCVLVFGGLITRKLLGRWQAVLVMFLINVCPYFMMASRFGFDCNLFLGCSTIVIYMLILAVEKDRLLYFVLAGIMIGITLYSYSLSWITMPLFLLLCLGLLLYMRKVKLVQIIGMGIPAGLMAIPLFLFLYINFTESDPLVTPFFTAPRIPYFRSDHFSLANIWENRNLFQILFTRDSYIFDAFDGFYTLFTISIPFAIIGGMIAIYIVCRSIFKRIYDPLAIIFVFTLAQTTCALLTSGIDIYRCNGIYFGLAFLIALGIIGVVRFVGKWKHMPSMLVLVCIVLGFLWNGISFWIFYFTKYEETYPIQWFMYDYIDEIYAMFHENETDCEIYIDDYNCSTYCYDMLEREISPYDYMAAGNSPYVDDMNFGNYHYYLPDQSDIRDDAIYVVMSYNSGYVDLMKSLGFSSQEVGYFYIFTR